MEGGEPLGPDAVGLRAKAASGSSRSGLRCGNVALLVFRADYVYCPGFFGAENVNTRINDLI